MKLYTTWFVFAGAPTAVLQYFERRRATSMARLAAVTRELRKAMEARTGV
jgi:hypothetical protein